MKKLIHLFIFTLVFAVSISHNCFAQKYSPDGDVYVMKIDGTINPAVLDYLESSFKKADGSSLIVILLNTPGGLVTSTQKIVSLILESEIPVAVYVSPSGGGAISAGVFITISGDFAVMESGTNIGAAHPVTATGDDIDGDMRQKVENFVASLAKTIAQKRGRNFEWVEKSVRDSDTLTSSEAVEKNVVDFVVGDLDALLIELEGKEVKRDSGNIVLKNLKTKKVVEVEMSLRQKIVNVLCDPNVAIILGMGALIGIGLEVFSPGLIFPGIFGVICLVLVMTSSQVIPISYGGVALLILSAVFIAIEAFVPSFGIWGIAGIICFLIGSLYAVDYQDVIGSDAFKISLAIIAGIASFFAFCFILIARVVFKSASGPNIGSKEGMIGAVVSSPTGFKDIGGRYTGKVRVKGELWDAELEGGLRYKEDASYKVKNLKGLKLILEEDN